LTLLTSPSNQLQDMQRGRGYEISPEHKAYMQVTGHQRLPPANGIAQHAVCKVFEAVVQAAYNQFCNSTAVLMCVA
jgi:hypothetical protein